MAYYSLVHPHLQYCLSSWGSASPTALNPLIKLQKKVIRIMTHSEFNASTTPLFQQLKILKLSDMHKLEVSKFMYKIVNNLSPIDSSHLVPLSQVHNYNTRHSTNGYYFIPRTATSLGKKSLKVLGPAVWAEVPKDIKNYSFYTF